MPIITNKKEENSFILLLMALIVVLTFIVPVSLPTESLTIISSAEALMNNGEIATNSVTLDEFQQWMINDTTMYHEYNDTYNCVKFSNDLRNNAQINGIKIYSVAVLEKNKNNHAINYGCFMDNCGKPVCVFIEPQTGEIFFNTSDYIRLNYKKNIVSITIKEGELEKNERYIKRIY